MPLSISNESKNSLSITNEAKPTGASVTWDEAIFTWDEASFPWTAIGLPINKETKNSLTITNESKN